MSREDSQDQRDQDSGQIPIHTRIRNRRQERGLAAYELAKRVGVSPSYVSLIEKGVKVPSEEVAGKLAVALDDDPELYRAWAHTSRYGDLEDTAISVARMRRYSDPRLRDRVSSGEDLADFEDTGEYDVSLLEGEQLLGDAELMTTSKEAPGVVSERRESSAPAGATRRTIARLLRPGKHAYEQIPNLVEVPVIQDRLDPGTGRRIPPELMLHTLHLDRATLPARPIRRPFAYRVSEEGVERVRGLLSPGDLVVINSRPVKRVSPERIYAVRFRDRIVLTRALFKDGTLLLLPPPEGGEFDVMEVRKPSQLPGLIAGTVVLTMRMS